MLTAEGFSRFGIANESVSSLESFHETLQVTFSDEGWTLFTDFDGLTREFELLWKEMEKIVYVYHDWNWTTAGHQMGLFLIADEDEMKQSIAMEGIDAFLDRSRMDEPTFEQSLEGRRLPTQIVFGHLCERP